MTFEEPLHSTGEECVVTRSMAEALARWLAAELIRRHPEDLRVIETHPGGGQYDCISIYHRGRSRNGPKAVDWQQLVVHMNIIPGSHLSHDAWFASKAEMGRFNWPEVLLCDDRRTYVVKQLERSAGLAAPPTMPVAKASSIGPRLIAAFLQRTFLGPARWRTDNGFCESSGGWASVREELFEQIPGAQAWRSQPRVENLLDTPEYRFWFLSRERADDTIDPPAFAVDTWTGHLWNKAGPQIDLLDRYVKGKRSIDTLVSDVCPPAV